jgi:hypothetical protein
MIFAPPPPPQFDTLYRPSYQEIGNEDILARYRIADSEVVDSREGSSYLRGLRVQVEARRKLIDLLRLPNDWNSFGAESPARNAIAVAGRVIDSLIRTNLVPDAVLPSAEGGVAICFVRDNRYADIECLNSGEILAVKSTRNEQPHAWAIDESSIDSDMAARNISAYLSL